MDINGFLMLNGRGAGPYTEDLAMRFLARAVTENSLNNAWNVNFSNGNVNNNNVTNTNRVRLVRDIWKGSHFFLERLYGTWLGIGAFLGG